MENATAVCGFITDGVLIGTVRMRGVRMIDESFFRLASASIARDKADWAHTQTSEYGRKRTIISVDADEALVIYLALTEYIKSRKKMLEQKGVKNG